MDKRFLLLVKHALPAIDPSIPAAMWRLSEEGQQSCFCLAERLRAYGQQRFLASPEPKATETATITARLLGLPVEIRQDLHEHLRPEASFSSREDFEANILRLFMQPGELVYGDETANEAHKRFSQAVQGAIADNPGETLAIVAHGTVITLYLSNLVGLDPFPFWKRLGMPSVVVLSLPELDDLEVIEQV